MLHTPPASVVIDGIRYVPAAANGDPATFSLVKADPTRPAFLIGAAEPLITRSGLALIIDGNRIDIGSVDVDLVPNMVPGTDYIIIAEAEAPTFLFAVAAADIGEHTDAIQLGGFHYALGGNAADRAGGDDIPAINPCSIWDINFRPTCPNPGGMVLVEWPSIAPVWVDIYLTAADHLVRGTSWPGADIADGSSLPENPAGGRFDTFDYATAQAVLAHHGKQLLSYDEFRAAAFGVTEKQAASTDPKVTGLDTLRTSQFGLMQATGNLWIWGHDGDPDEPRACLFGGSWLNDVNAGSRQAFVDYWPGNSYACCGARGRSDHLTLA